MSPHKLPEQHGKRQWAMGTEAFERTMPHHQGIKALWETKWKFPCTKSVYPFHDGQYEDFEPVFEHLIKVSGTEFVVRGRGLTMYKNNINDGTSTAYTEAFFPIAESLTARGDQAASAGNKKEASDLYLRACTVYRIARFPYITAYPEVSCSVKWKAWEAQKEVYLKAAQSWDCPIRDIDIPHAHAKGGDRKSIPAYSCRHPDDRPRWVPPDNTVRSDEFLARGWGSVIVEIPGTADSPADSADPESPDRLWSSVLDWIAADGRFNTDRVLVWGLSSGGYYAIRIAHTHKDRLIGSIAQGAGCHHFFDPEWLEKADGHEYPFLYVNPGQLCFSDLY
ncbi:pigment biosynthesis protein Ayg1 [Colletotrichum tofieldiae]|nr:pigment biosynthesis protein Ayg1 [Colletotrichum tofieldiae]